MKTKKLKLPFIILAVGLIAIVVAYLLTAIVKRPVITEHDFAYSVTYQLNGETKELEGIYRCRYSAENERIDPYERYYEGVYLSNSRNPHSAAHTIAEQGESRLCIVVILTSDYLMGDGEDEEAENEVPYLAVCDAEDREDLSEEALGAFDVELLSWEMPKPIKNSFTFGGFACVHDGSMAAMLLVGVLAIVACLIFVKKEEGLSYKGLDKASIALNWVVGFAAIPFMSLIAWLMELYVSGDEFIYQAQLCVPAITALTLAASVALRRKGFAKTGFFIQFVGPALFVIFSVLEVVVGCF